MQNLYQFLAIIERLGQVLSMEEHKQARLTECQKSDVKIKFENASFSWGFKIQEDQEDQKGKSNAYKLKI